MRNIIWGTAMLLILAAPAFAADKRIDFGQILLDDDDKPITECAQVDAAKQTCAQTENVTLGMQAARALNGRYQDEANLPMSELVHRGQMAYWIKRAGVVSLTTDSKCQTEFADCLTVADRDLIDKLVSKNSWGTLVIWRIISALSGNVQGEGK